MINSRNLTVTIFIALCLIFTNGCSTYKSGNEKISKMNYIKKIKSNKTDKKHILKWFGETKEIRNVDGEEKWKYSYHYKKRYFLPFFDDESDTYHLEIFFDKLTSKVLEYNFYEGNDAHFHKGDPNLNNIGNYNRGGYENYNPYPPENYRNYNRGYDNSRYVDGY